MLILLLWNVTIALSQILRKVLSEPLLNVPYRINHRMLVGINNNYNGKTR